MNDDAVLPFAISPYRTNPQAFGVLTVIAAYGDENPGRQSKVFFPQLINLAPTDRSIALIFIFASHFTAPAANAFFGVMQKT